MIPSTYKVFQRVYWGQELLKKIEVCKTTPPTAPLDSSRGTSIPTIMFQSYLAILPNSQSPYPPETFP